jgi:hypothetical protein
MRYSHQAARPAFEMSVEDFFEFFEAREQKRLLAQARLTTTTLNKVFVEHTPAERRRLTLQAEKDTEQ